MKKIDLYQAALSASKFTFDMSEKRVKYIEKQISKNKLKEIYIYTSGAIITLLNGVALINPDKYYIRTPGDYVGLGIALTTIGLVGTISWIDEKQTEKKSLEKKLKEAKKEKTKAYRKYGNMLVNSLKKDI